MAISERELLNAMVASGRSVSFSTLADWRRCGLLSPFSTRSQGFRKGKTCFWPDDDTLDRAFLIYDLMQRAGERHNVFWLLWLSGVNVPLPYVRRAWRHRAKTAYPPAERNSDSSPAHVTMKRRRAGLFAHGHITPSQMLQVALMAGEALGGSDDPELNALVAALDGAGARNTRWGRHADTDGALRRQMLALLGLVWSAVRGSDLIAAASDEELLECQEFTSRALRDLEQCDEPVPHRNRCAWPVEAAEKFGAPLYFLILIMLKSGQRALLDTALGQAHGDVDLRERSARSIPGPDLRAV